MKTLATMITAVLVTAVCVPSATQAMSLVSTTFTKAESVKLRFNGKDMSTSTGEFKAQIMDDQGKLVNGGEWFKGFCVELSQYAQSGGKLPVNFVATDKVSGGAQAAWIYKNRKAYFPNHTSWSKAEISGLQLAIWEVTHDYTPDMKFDLTKGNFAVVTASTAAKELAKFYLDTLVKSFSTEGLYKYTIAQNATKQDLLFNYQDPAVPEPSTLLLVGFGLVGLAGSYRKIKR